MPLLRVGSDLRGRGHDVTMLTGSEYRRAIHDFGMQSVALPEAARPCRPRDSYRAPSLVKRCLSGRAEIRSVFIAPLAAQFDALRDVLCKQRFDAVLCDISFTGVLPLLLCDKPRPLVLVCGVGPLTLTSVDTAPFGIGWQPKPCLDYRSMTWTVHNVLLADIQSRLNDQLAALGAPRSPVFLTDWPVLADRILQFSIPAMEYPRSDLPAAVSFTGPIIGETPQWSRPAQTTSARSVVHVTQGTWDNEDLDELIAPTLDGLADRDDLLVVATTGRQGQSQLKRATPPNAYVTDYVPYSELLPGVDVVVTNGGYGGVHHALLHGIPLVVAGRTADKPEVAARVAYAGAGIDLRTARPAAAAVAGAVQRVLSTPRYREAACRLGREMRRYNAFDHIADALSALSAPQMIEE
jgi:UDP:flavonoid glycosyltransferase YjiC (YdhE family)